MLKWAYPPLKCIDSKTKEAIQNINALQQNQRGDKEY